MRWKERDGSERNQLRTAQSFCVPKAEIAAAGYDLSLNRYKQVEHEERIHSSPADILRELRVLEETIANSLTNLEEMLG
jgi:type I restriction enzyme M protein